MSRAIIIQRISRRTGVKGIPRSLVLDGIVRLNEGDDLRDSARKVLTQVKRRVKRDGNDRQINAAEVRTLKNGRHDIRQRVLYRVYKSESDKLIHTYPGEAHQGVRANL